MTIEPGQWQKPLTDDQKATLARQFATMRGYWDSLAEAFRRIEALGR